MRTYLLLVSIMIFLLACESEQTDKQEQTNSTIAQTAPLPDLDAGPLETLRPQMAGTYSAQIKCKTCDSFEPIELSLQEDGTFTFQQAKPTNISYDGKWTIAKDTSLLLYRGAEQIGAIGWASEDYRYVRIQDIKDAYYAPNQRLVKQAPARMAEPEKGIVGMYLYFADVGLITLCDSGKTYPVQLTPQTISLEREYLKRGRGPEFKLLVAVEGDFEQRKNVDTKRTEEVLIVEKVVKIYPDSNCQAIQ